MMQEKDEELEFQFSIHFVHPDQKENEQQKK
jgi:hypothetical protein